MKGRTAVWRHWVAADQRIDAAAFFESVGRPYALDDKRLWLLPRIVLGFQHHGAALDFPWRICRDVAVITRAVGLVGHLSEEMENPLACEIWERVEQEVFDSRDP